ALPMPSTQVRFLPTTKETVDEATLIHAPVSPLRAKLYFCAAKIIPTENKLRFVTVKKALTNM
ncbi:MAG: hypothetical protein AAF597_09925, partial [Bacteroidota bacterium]